MHTIDSPFQTHILGRDHWSPLESIWTVRGTEKYWPQLRLTRHNIFIIEVITTLTTVYDKEQLLQKQ